MKSTGVLRRIDDLGRIVIPKEIRKHLRIRDGEYLEIFIDEEVIILKKHSMINMANDIAQLCVDSVGEVTDAEIIVSDRDKVIAASSALKKKYIGKEITENVSAIILKRFPFTSDGESTINIVKDEEEKGRFMLIPIIANGDAVGIISIIPTNRDLNDFDKKIASFISKIISKHIE